MSSIRNRVQLIGNVGENPKITKLESGKKVANFSLATNEGYTNQEGEKVVHTEWHDLVAWGKTADIVEQFINKGKQIVVDGALRKRSYEDKEGQKRYVTEILVHEVVLT